MALIQCGECGREISDKAASCIGCGAPIENAPSGVASPTSVKLNSDGTFTGTRPLLVKLAAKAILEIGWKLDNSDEKSGLVAFTTGVTWGSWSGVSGTIYIDEVGEYRFNAIGSAKQNVRGAQMLAFNIGNEAQNKANKVIETMRQLAR